MSYRDSYYSNSRSRDDYSYRDRDNNERGSGRHRDMPLDCKVYVGALPEHTSERDIYDHFEKCGPLRNVWVARNPPGFAFVEFVDPRDAEDAVRRLDGISLNGVRIRVEHSTGKVKPKSWNRRGPPRPRRPFNPDDRCFECQRTGHYAYDCPNASRRSRRSRSRSHSRGRGRRSYSRSRSRSRSASRSRSRSRSRSNDRHRRERSRSRSASHHSE